VIAQELASQGQYIVYVMDHLDGSCCYTESEYGSHLYTGKVDKGLRAKEIKDLTAKILTRPYVSNSPPKILDFQSMDLPLKNYLHTDLVAIFPFEIDYHISHHFKLHLPFIQQVVPRWWLPQQY
jgi:hypothetical protein